MTRLLVELKEIANTDFVPSARKLEKHTERLDYMRHFYDGKMVDAPRKQAAMFNGFSLSLMFATDVIAKYRSLTLKLEKLIKQAEEEEL